MNARGQRYAELLNASSNLRAFLHVVRVGEGTADPDGYRRHFGGELFTSFVDHPRRAITRSLGGKPLTSTAAGAYQHLRGTWDECAKACALPDFSPACQDVAAVFLIDRRGALADVLAGRLDQAIARCNREWASLPGSPYGQPVRTLAQARKSWDQFLASDTVPTASPAPAAPAHLPQPGPAAPTQPPPEPAMLPLLPSFIAAALPSLVAAIPRLGQLFGSGSEVSERNLAAAQTVVGIVQQATGARNLQEAVELVSTDPAMAAAAAQAVQAVWFELTEVGGGVQAARAANAAAMAPGAPPMLKNPAFIITLLLLVFPLMMLLDVFFFHPTAYTGEIRVQIVTALLAVLSIAAGYWIGTSFSSAKKDDLATRRAVG